MTESTEVLRGSKLALSAGFSAHYKALCLDSNVKQKTKILNSEKIESGASTPAGGNSFQGVKTGGHGIGEKHFYWQERKVPFLAFEANWTDVHIVLQLLLDK